MGLLRKLAGLALGFVAILAGCWNSGGGWELLYGPQPLYGTMPPNPHDPTVTLDDFSYTPPSPARPGDKLLFTATTNKPMDNGSIGVGIGNPPRYNTYLNDSGFGADDVANDGKWHGELEIPPDATPAPDLPTIARLSWWDGSDGKELAGDDLTILEDGE